MIDISELESRLKKAQSRAEKAQTALNSATAEAIRLETALSVVREMIGTPTGSISGTGNLTAKQRILVNSLKYGQNNALSPVDVYGVAAQQVGFDGDVNYVRTTLWRMADKGTIGSANGTYWRFEDAPEALVADSANTARSAESRETSGKTGPWDPDLDDCPF